jgi:hypothetical protein
VTDFFLLEGDRPSRALELARLLTRNGIEVERVSREVRARCADVLSDTTEERVIPAGSYRVPVGQPAARLVRSLLDRHVDMGAAFVKRQMERAKRGLRDEIYDVTAWSLPLAFGVPCLAAESAVSVASKPWVEGRNPGAVVGGPAKVAYLVNGDDDAAALALCEWLRAGLRVHVASEPLKLNKTALGKGSLIVKVRENGEGVHAAVEKVAHAHGLRVHAADTAYVDEGAGLGGPNVRWVKPPRVLLAVDRPTSYGVGHTWYLFDEVWRYPVTRVACRNLGGVDLRKYDVLILPDGQYASDSLEEPPVLRIREWVRQGGTLILVKGAAAWAAGDKVRLLAGRPEPAPAKGDKPAGDKPAPEKPAAEKQPTREAGQRVPGAFLRAEVEEGHWVTFGVKPSTAVHYSGSPVLHPLKRGEGKNLVTFVEGGRLLASGFCWPGMLKQMEGRPYAVYQSSGAGHIVAFADDPNFRAASPETQRLFLNAVLFGPGQ